MLERERCGQRQNVGELDGPYLSQFMIIGSRLDDGVPAAALARHWQQARGRHDSARRRPAAHAAPSGEVLYGTLTDQARSTSRSCPALDFVTDYDTWLQILQGVRPEGPPARRRLAEPQRPVEPVHGQPDVPVLAAADGRVRPPRPDLPGGAHRGALDHLDERARRPARRAGEDDGREGRAAVQPGQRLPRRATTRPASGRSATGTCSRSCRRQPRARSRRRGTRSGSTSAACGPRFSAGASTTPSRGRCRPEALPASAPTSPACNGAGHLRRPGGGRRTSGKRPDGCASRQHNKRSRTRAQGRHDRSSTRSCCRSSIPRGARRTRATRRGTRRRSRPR